MNFVFFVELFMNLRMQRRVVERRGGGMGRGRKANMKINRSKAHTKC